MRRINGYTILYRILELLRMLTIVFIIVMLLFTFVTRKKTVAGSSMYPTLKDGELVLINVAASYLCDIERFDVVVAHREQENDLLVKRVIGLPNETIRYEDDVLYVNGEAIDEPFLDEAYKKQVKEDLHISVFTKDVAEITLQEDEYFLVGDNRYRSLDSRHEEIGPFKREQIIAKGMLVYYPFDEMKYIDNGG